MKNLRKLSTCWLAMLLAIVMCLGMLNLTAFADEGDSSGGACEA